MHKLAAALRAMGQDRLLENEPMSGHTTFRVGGPADLMFFPESGDEILSALKLAGEEGVPAYVVGNGSNLIVRDGGIRGLVIVLGEHLSAVRIEGNCLYAQAGASLARVSAAAQAAGLSGLEFASGIPGTLGGGCAMNAGAYGGQLSDCLTRAQVLIDGRIETVSREEMEFGYRTSMPLKTGAVVLWAEMTLKDGDRNEIGETMRELNRRRREKQPLELPSAGSTFKRPEGYFAGALIEEAGLKGLSVGGAQVSEKHAGFIVNKGGATGDDILALIRLVQEKVFEHSGVRLEREVRLLGEEPV